MKTSVQSPMRDIKKVLWNVGTTTMLSGYAKATANSTFYNSVHGLLEKNYGCCCCVPLSLHSNNLSQLFDDYTTKQMVQIHNYSCIRKWQYIYQ
jgi:hypothetical protein